MFEDELEAALSRPRYARSAKPLSGDGEDAVCVSGHRHGHRSRSLHREIEKPAHKGEKPHWSARKIRDKEVDDGIWLVSFSHYDLGYFDLEQKTLQTLDNPFGPRLSPMS